MQKGLHIAIILDGNRRYAEKKRMKPWQGHKFGADKVTEMMDWCLELNIRELTLYTFSIENFTRPEQEKKELFKLFSENIRKLESDRRVAEKGIKIRFIGRIGMFPAKLAQEMKKIMETTSQYGNYTINFAMAYGGRAEITDAARKIADSVKAGKINPEEIVEDLLTENMYLADEPDLVIRPGGEKRVSNFLLWQSYYSEWYFTDKLWPEFTKQDMISAIDDFKKRERRFGK